MVTNTFINPNDFIHVRRHFSCLFNLNLEMISFSKKCCQCVKNVLAVRATFYKTFTGSLSQRFTNQPNFTEEVRKLPSKVVS